MRHCCQLWLAQACHHLSSHSANTTPSTAAPAPTAEVPDTAPARRRASPRPPQLPGKTAAALYSRALAGALEDLKGQLPAGYLLSKAQARVAPCLPAVATSLAAIVG